MALEFFKENKNICIDILKISIPAVIDLLAQSMLSISDLAMVGAIGKEAISSVGLGNIPINIILPALCQLLLELVPC